MFKALFVATALSLAAALPNPAQAKDEKTIPSISLTGHGEVRLAPDMAVVTVGVLSSANTAREALDANTKSMDAIFASLKAAGIDARDLQTSNFMVNPRYDYSQGNGTPPKMMGYDVSNNVTVTVRKLENLGKVLDQAVSSGSNQINGVAFQVAKPDVATDAARKLAVANAIAKAKVYTEAAGVGLGPILNIAEGGSYQPPVPVFAKTMRADAAGSVPIAEGEQVIGIDVNITWELNSK